MTDQIRETRDRLCIEISQSVQSKEARIQNETELLERILQRISALRESTPGKISKLRTEIADVTAVNWVLRKSKTRKEAGKRFDIQCVREAKAETLEQLGQAQQRLKCLNASQRSAQAELHALTLIILHRNFLHCLHERRIENITPHVDTKADRFISKMNRVREINRQMRPSIRRSHPTASGNDKGDIKATNPTSQPPRRKRARDERKPRGGRLCDRCRRRLDEASSADNVAFHRKALSEIRRWREGAVPEFQLLSAWDKQLEDLMSAAPSAT